MTEFERGLDRALAIYRAGLVGDPMPRFPQIALRDARLIYSSGVEDALDEVNSIEYRPLSRDFIKTFA
jgi:hypothetical protein